MAAPSTADHEREALSALRERLLERYPGVEPETVDAAIAAAHRDLDGPIRDFVPLLVERAARRTLDATVAAAAGPSAPSP